MGRLVGYGPGEIVDRLSILSLKILHGNQAGKNTKHFADEQEALIECTPNHVSPDFMALGDVNCDLWKAEDELRDWRSRTANTTIEQFCVPIAALAFRIQDLNDRRAALIEKINAASGETSGPEKLT